MMNDDVSVSILQMGGAWRLMCAAAPRPVVADGEGIQYIFSGLPVGFFNIALLTGSDLSADELRGRGRDACAWAATQGVPWFFIVTHERIRPDVDVAATLDACGLAVALPLTGMRAEKVDPPAAVQDLMLAVPTDDGACASLVDVNGHAYEMDLDAAKTALGSRAFWKDQFPVLGLANGQPVCSAAAMIVDGHRYVALVATEPGQQRRGFADAAMRQALANAAAVH